MAEETIRVLEDRSTEISKTDMQRGKKIESELHTQKLEDYYENVKQ
jgi:hypothetical protein